MEEAHNYLSSNTKNSASHIVQRIVKEGRKYGIGVMIVSQRPSEISETVLSQCGTFISLRLSNRADRGHICSAVSDNLESLTSMLPILKTGEAIILGESVKLPMRVFIEPPPRNHWPDSQDPVIYDEVEKQYSVFGRPSIDPVVLFKIHILKFLFHEDSLRKTYETLQYNLLYR